MASIPAGVRQTVLEAIYARFDDLHWESLGNAARTDEYARMVTDPAIGLRLAPYLDSGDIRVWIKDGPAKEYRRALGGFGPYADLTARTAGGPDRVITAALGSGWSVRPDTVKHKPTRCVAVDEAGREVFVVWGDFRSLKELTWHAVRERAEHPDRQPLIALTRPSSARVSDGEWRLTQRICQVIGARCVQVVQEVTRKTSP